MPFFFSLDPYRKLAYTHNIPPSFACLANKLMTTQNSKFRRLLADIVALIVVAQCGSVVTSIAAQPIDFARDIRPIISKCIACHGPAKQENGLRLDNAKDAAKLKAIIAGKPELSGVIKRVTSTDPDLRMPPVETGEPLTNTQIETLRSWISAGAEFSPHWAFQPISEVNPPKVSSSWMINEIDPFIFERLQNQQLTPSKLADKATLLRRASLDLIGLPPTVHELTIFLKDNRPDAYERQVRRLLSSPHYGERQARNWLDLARYADSNGYTIDGPRSIWPWRDWVINALNSDMPFDQFTTEQLAGDLIPNATSSQILATGFHRNTAYNEEGGTDPEQFRVERTIDRTNTTGTVWLGLTVGCAQCHDHKYDPIRQRDYYQLYAYFNQAEEPKISVNSDEVNARIKLLKSELANLQRKVPNAKAAEIPSNDFINQFRFASGNDFQVSPVMKASAKVATLKAQPDFSILASGPSTQAETYQIQIKSPLAKVTAIRLEALTDPTLPKTGPGRASNGNFILSRFSLTVNGISTPLSTADADIEQDKYPVKDAILGLPKRGWSINPGPSSNLNQPRTAIFRLAKPLSITPDSELLVELQFPDKPAGYHIGKFRLSVTDAANEFLDLPIEAQKIVTSTLAPLETSQKQAFMDLVQLKSKQVDPQAVALRDRIRKLEETTTSLAISEAEKLRTTRILQRGDFLQPGDTVFATTPQVFDSNTVPAPTSSQTRLELAEWLTNRNHPLTSRVAVNREWQKFFGTGLVETENDFGLQGSLPTHPELLDYLAKRFMNHGWSLKQLHYLITTSATYRQSSHHRNDITIKDPQNRLLGRQNRLRLDAETLRDNALTVSGKLSPVIGGPPVFPPQPAELFQFTQSQRSWVTSSGPDRYRRGLYTWIWRQSRHPLITTFDGADAQVACTKRNRSNTPIQALHLANDPVFVELSTKWASQLMADHSSSDDVQKLQYLYQAALNRMPLKIELDQLSNLLKSERLTGRSEIQSWTTIARVLMNTDEFITRE